MHRIQGLQKSDKPLIPANQFDLIAGTGTGGISACMLGRLGMSIDKAIDEYGKLVKTVFAEKKLVGPTLYKKTKLQQALRSMVREATGNEEEPMLRQGIDTDRCKTVIFAMAKNNMRACLPVLFRSYRAVANPGPGCLIREALYATMAHPDFFKSIKLCTFLGQQSFVGGELGCSNPIGHVLSEAKKLYPNRHIACILSIGAGHARIIRVPDRNILYRFIRTQDMEPAKQMVTDSERLADEMAARFSNTNGVYFRLNVDQEVPEPLDEIAHARAYLRMSEVTEAVERAARSISEKRATIPTEFIGKSFNSSDRLKLIHCTLVEKRRPKLKYCPAPTRIYTGYVDESNQVERCLTSFGDNQPVCVICGLGGVGKTQLALNVIQRTRSKWDHLIYIDASSSEAIENTLQDLAIVKGIGETYMDTINWLERCSERWLLLLDGADDRSVGIRGLAQYLPGGGRGSIIITTRLTELTILAKGPGSICRLSKMRQEDALELLLKMAGLERQTLIDGEMEAAHALLQDLGYLALAIVHAGTYIGRVRSISITKYRELFLSRRLRIFDHSGVQGTIDSYGKAIPVTWKMCYELLDARSRPMLWLIAFLHHENICESLFKRAAQLIGFRENVIPPTEVEIMARTHVEQYLSTFLGSERCWDSVRFAEVMADLTSCSLIDFDQINIAYSVHVLVQDWVSTVIPQPYALALECTTTVLSMSTGTCNNLYAESVFKRQLGSHINSIMKRKYEIGASHASGFARICFQTGQWNQARRLEESVLATYKQLLGEKHPATLESINNLVSIHLSLGLWDEAEELGLKNLETCKRVLGDENVFTLTAAMSNISITHIQLGRLSEAEQLLLQILCTYRRWLCEGHWAILQVKGYLVSAYSHLGQWSKAKQLGTEVLDLRMSHLEKAHPETLVIMGNLVSIYLDLGQWKEAQQMLKQVLDLCEETLGAEHPQKLTHMSNLVSIYSFLGQWDDAEKLGNQILAARKQLLGEDHPDTLASMNNLASAYSNLGQLDKANQLLVHVLRMHEQLFGTEHPLTLTSMSNLAVSYSELGQWDEGERMAIQVLTTRKRLLGNDHPDTLVSMGDVALRHTYHKRWGEAEQLQIQVLDACRRLLGEEHPYTLRGMSALAVTYAHLGRDNDAKLLLTMAIDISKRELGDQHPDTRLYEKNMTYVKTLGYLRNIGFCALFVRLYIFLLFLALVCQWSTGIWF